MRFRIHPSATYISLNGADGFDEEFPSKISRQHSREENYHESEQTMTPSFIRLIDFDFVVMFLVNSARSPQPPFGVLGRWRVATSLDVEQV